MHGPLDIVISYPVIFDEFLVTLKVVFKIKGACNASNDAISVISVTNSNSLVHKTMIVKRFDFHHTKVMCPLEVSMLPRSELLMGG